ncbi:MAG: 4'-phosphopantetheinyl transferase family protein [Armatimonadota bacterium]
MSGGIPWEPSGEPPELLENEVLVWRVAIPEDAPAPELAAVLSPDERERAGRYHFARDRHRYLTVRGTLRLLLARYVDLAPETLRFRYGPFGKPELEGCPGEIDLRFNVSHSGDLGLIALTRGRAVGVDVEQVRPELSYQELADRYFSPAEAAAIRALPAETRRLAFFHCWTRKEAYVKARGDGLSRELAAFSVSVAPDEPAALLQCASAPDAPSRWSLQTLNLGPGYVGALAVESPLRLARCLRLPGSRPGVLPAEQRLA